MQASGNRLTATRPPSSGGNGNILKNASQTFIDTAKEATAPNGIILSAAKNASAKITFVIGPATDIIPLAVLDRDGLPHTSDFGYMYTAPGAANTQPKREDARAIAIPVLHMRNSAWAPYFLATALCASS